MSIFRRKKWLFVIYAIIAVLAGISNFMEPANLLVAASVGLSICVILAGDEMAILYLFLALCPFYSSLRFGGLYVGAIIPMLAICKLMAKKSTIHSPILGIFSVIFLFVWFLHDVQFVTFASALFRLMVPACIFVYICRGHLENYDGYFAIWVIISTTLIAMVSIFMVQGGDIDTFIYASYAGEIRLGEADVDDGQKNQLGGAMGFPIYTITIVSLSIQMLMTRKFKMWQKTAIVGLDLALFFVTFLTISRVYILGIITLALMLFLHMVKSRSLKTILCVLLGCMIIYVIASVYLPEYMDEIFDSYLTRQSRNSDNGGTGIRGAIYEDCIKYLSENIECLLIGKGSSAYPLLGAKIHRLFSWSAHNMILDALMAFGILGTFVLLYLYCHLYAREKRRTGIKWSVFRIMPFVCYIMMNMTATPFIIDKTYPMLLFLTLNVIHCTDKSEYDKRINGVISKQI